MGFGEKRNVLSVRGGLIAEHRSLRRISFSRHLLIVTLLPALLSFLAWWWRDAISVSWKMACLFWIEKLELATPGELSRRLASTWFESALVWVDLATKTPDGIRWWVVLAVTAIALLLSGLIPDRALPLRYIVRVACFIQVTALGFFAASPNAFPYTLSAYVGSSLQAGLWLLLLIPWVHAFVFYIFDFSLLKKVSLTLLTMGFIIVALPLQLMTHAYLIVNGSLLLLPLLYFLFGTPLLILVCVALYGWGMSWRHGVRPPEGTGGSPV